MECTGFQPLPALVQPRMDIISELPKELSFIVFSYLSIPTLGSASLVSKNWKMLSQDDSIWDQFLEKSPNKSLHIKGDGDSLNRVKNSAITVQKFIQNKIESKCAYFLYNFMNYFDAYENEILLSKTLKIKLVNTVIDKIKSELTGMLHAVHTPMKMYQFDRIVEILMMDETKKDAIFQGSDLPSNQTIENTPSWDTLFIGIYYLTRSVQQSNDFDQNHVKERLKSLFTHFISLGFDLHKEISWSKKPPIQHIQYLIKNVTDNPLYLALNELDEMQKESLSI